MERLTNPLIVPKTGEVLAYKLNPGVTDTRAKTKLGKYEDLEEQGLLFRLPCKVGDTVYEASKRWNRILERIVASIVFYAENRIYLRNGCGDSFEFGVEVFLTQEEAEAALGKVKGA